MHKHTSVLRRFAPLCAGALLLAGTAGAQAALVLNFGDGTGNGTTSFQKSAGGVTATFSNPQGRATFTVDNFSGIQIGNVGAPVSAFDVVFDKDIDLISFNSDGAYGMGGTLTIGIAGPGVSSNTLYTAFATVPFVGQPLRLQASQTYAVTANVAGSVQAWFKAWNFDIAPAPVPAPAPLALVLTGLGIAGCVRRARG